MALNLNFAQRQHVIRNLKADVRLFGLGILFEENTVGERLAAVYTLLTRRRSLVEDYSPSLLADLLS